jgi:hypothetical protein
MSSQSSPEFAGDAPLQPPIEARLVQAGKLSMGQLAQAHRDRLENGKPLLDIIVERGWVSAEEIAELDGPRPAPTSVSPAEYEQVDTPAEPEPAPAPTPEPATAPAPEPVAAAEPEPVPSETEQQVLVGIRLTTGDLVPAGYAEGPEKAATLGQAVVAELMQADDEWPFFDGRFLKPDTIVSVDLVVDD